VAAALAITATACGGDASTVEGALASAASAVGARDYGAMFQALDERARFSIGSVFQTRRRAADIIQADYPPEARASALGELGDALEVDSATDLFRRRCPDACLDAIAGSLGAPSAVHVEGRIATVKTVRGTEAKLYRADDGRYGLVWESEALMRERSRAAAELDFIQKNAATYRAQNALQGAH